LKSLQRCLKDREWILHAATQDLPCLNELGLYPGGIFDTELAGRLAGAPRVGLGSLSESLLQFRLAKEHSAADWSTRPLPESWLNYAALDVDVLHELASAVKDLLNQQGKLDWANQEFASLMSFKPKPQRIDKWRGITGLHKVQDRLSHEIARQLWIARESLAQKMDVAPGRLIPDSSILVAATQKPKSRPELAALKAFSGRASRSYLDLWWDAVQSALKATELPSLKPEKTEAIPNHRNWITKFPEADRRLKHAKASLQNSLKKSWFRWRTC
jgi:ribonuclease D